MGNTDFKSLIWLKHSNEFKRQQNYTTIENCENVNRQNDSIGGSPITKSNRDNFFVLTINITTDWYIDKKDLSDIMVDKLELFSDYTVEIETYTGVLFKDTLNTDSINCFNYILEKCFIKIKEYTESKLGIGSYQIPPKNVILNFARTLGTPTVN